MPPTAGARLVVLGLIAAAGAACSTNILHGVDETAANESVSALERVGVAAEKRADEGNGTGFSIRVARADQAKALDQLRSLGLPRERRTGFAEVYGQPSLIPTASEERARYVEALAGEVARTLETADGVVSARVHLVLGENDPLGIDSKPRTAARGAVLLKARPGRLPLSEVEIQKLVAGSVPGLEPSAVAVVVTPAPSGGDVTPGTLAAVGPLRVTAGSRPLLLAALVVGLAVLGLLAGLLLFTARRLAALERAQRSKTP